MYDSNKDGIGINVPEEDYSIEYHNNYDAANANDEDAPYVVVNFNTGDYAGTDPIKKTFTIEQASVENVKIKWGEEKSFVYDGTVHYPTVKSAVYTYTDADGEEQTYTLKPEDYDLVDYFGTVAGEKRDDGYLSMVDAAKDWQINLKGKGNFKGTAKENLIFAIDPVDFAKANVTVDVDQIEYDSNLESLLTKNTLKDYITITDNVTGVKLEKNQYKVQVQNEDGDWVDTLDKSAVTIGTHAMRIVGVAGTNYAEDTYLETSYEVVAASLATAVKDATVKTFTNNEAEYDGKDKFPKDLETALDVKDLKYDLDYVITTPKTEWINAGEYSLTLEGRNKYAGQTATVTVKITPKKLPSAVVEQGTHPSGNLGSVVVTVTDTINDKTVVLENGKDYTYEVTKEASNTSKKGKVELIGIGNYTTEDEINDVQEVEFTLKEKLPLSDPSISSELTKDFAYTGDPITVSLSDIKLIETDGNKTYTLTSGDYAIVKGTEKIDKNFAGQHVVELTGTGDYTGTRYVVINVGGISVSDMFEVAKIDDVSKDDDVTLLSDLIDKKLKVTFAKTGGGYTNYDKKVFDPEGNEIAASKWSTYDLTKAETGIYTIQIDPKDTQYVGTLETTFNVVGYDLKKAGAVVADIEDQVYTSEAITPAVTVKVGNKILKAGEDYEVTYTDNVKGGEATAIITGINDYSGTLEKNFNITRAAQGITMTNPLQERDLGNGSRTSTSKVCTLKLATTMADEDTKYTYTTSDPSVATVNNGKITYEGVGECTITVSAAATDSCEVASLDIKVVVGKPGTPTFTPSVTRNTAKKAFVVTSSTVKGVDGWEVQYSIKDTFWKATTKDFPGTKTKLLKQTCKTVHSNMTYYVRVRGYQTVDGEKVYSDWSPVKTIKTK